MLFIPGIPHDLLLGRAKRVKGKERQKKKKKKTRHRQRLIRIHFYMSKAVVFDKRLGQIVRTTCFCTKPYFNTYCESGPPGPEVLAKLSILPLKLYIHCSVPNVFFLHSQKLVIFWLQLGSQVTTWRHCYTGTLLHYQYTGSVSAYTIDQYTPSCSIVAVYSVVFTAGLVYLIGISSMHLQAESLITTVMHQACDLNLWPWPQKVNGSNSDVQTRFLTFDLDFWPTTLTFNPNLA